MKNEDNFCKDQFNRLLKRLGNTVNFASTEGGQVSNAKDN